MMHVADYLVVGSDSGRIVILEYHPEKAAFERVHQVRSDYLNDTKTSFWKV